MRTRIKPSPVRSVGPREEAFLLGTPKGEFEPAPMYLDGKLSPVEPRNHSYECECESCRECRTPFEGSPDDCAFGYSPIEPSDVHRAYDETWAYIPEHKPGPLGAVYWYCVLVGSISLAILRLVR